MFIFANGNVRKVQRYNVQLCESEEEESKTEEYEESKVKFKDDDLGNGIVEQDLEENRMVMGSMTNVQ